MHACTKLMNVTRLLSEELYLPMKVTLDFSLLIDVSTSSTSLCEVDGKDDCNIACNNQGRNSTKIFIIYFRSWNIGTGTFFWEYIQVVQI